MSSPNLTLAEDHGESTFFGSSFHVIIVGAGLIGLATAILLRKGGFKVTVLERDMEMREVSFDSIHQLSITHLL